MGYRLEAAELVDGKFVLKLVDQGDPLDGHMLSRNGVHALIDHTIETLSQDPALQDEVVCQFEEGRRA